MQYRKKPVVINAMQFDGFNHDDIYDWANGLVGEDNGYGMWEGDDESAPNSLVIDTLEGPLHASPGDWIICGVKQEFYPCKPDIFAQTYEAV